MTHVIPRSNDIGYYIYPIYKNVDQSFHKKSVKL